MNETAIRRHEVLVVGAGFSGLYMVHKLRQDGFDVHGIEAAPGPGGTWYWNRYPGARCDIPSIEYSYSFDPELEAEWRWTERYAAQPEILAYLEHVADRFDLRPAFTFAVRVNAAAWDDANARWDVTTDCGSRWQARFLILATGALSTPKLPDLPGLADFGGPVIHTAQWDESVQLGGRNVCLFGTGSSGIQAVSEIAKVVSQLTVFQRTPNFTVPAGNHPLTDEYLAKIRPHLPQLRAKARASALGWFSGPQPGSAKADDPVTRRERLQAAWDAGTTGLLTAYEDLLFDEESNAYAGDFAREKIRELVHDSDKARKLTPHGYPVGSRRTCTETGFYDAMNRDNVMLVDVREEPVEQITSDAVRTGAASYPADVIVLATGFDACVGAIKAIAISGRGGAQIAEEWADGPRAYLGLAVAGFPNMFTITGPGSPSVLSNVVVSIEQHVEWIARCLGNMRDLGATTIEAQAAAEDAWMAHTDEVAHQTLFPKAESWYQGRRRNGELVFMPYVGGCGAYRDKCDDVAANGYEGFTMGGVA